HRVVRHEYGDLCAVVLERMGDLSGGEHEAAGRVDDQVDRALRIGQLDGARHLLGVVDVDVAEPELLDLLDLFVDHRRVAAVTLEDHRAVHADDIGVGKRARPLEREAAFENAREGQTAAAKDLRDRGFVVTLALEHEHMKALALILAPQRLNFGHGRKAWAALYAPQLDEDDLALAVRQRLLLVSGLVQEAVSPEVRRRLADHATGFGGGQRRGT